MAEQFEDRDLSDSVFWGVNLQRCLVRDADLSGTRFFHTLWSDVSVDGVVDRLVVNGVDVTDYVNAHDRWYPLRTQLEPATADSLRSAWAVLQGEWHSLLQRAGELGPQAVLQSVNGEWCLRDTLRHLLFAMDKWFSGPVLGAREFTSFGLPNTGSQGGDWPGLEPAADPSFDEVLAARAEHAARFGAFIGSLDFAGLPETVEVLENGTVPAVMCFHVVLEEEFEHLRYALRDLDIIEAERSGTR
ncbi:MAG: hypothetical protein RI900_1764 [Actinomycetota bacterium]